MAWKLLNTYDFGTTSETSGKVYFTNPIKTNKILVKGTTASAPDYVWAYFSNAASTAGFCFRVDHADYGNPRCNYGVLDETWAYRMASIATSTQTIEGVTWYEIDFPAEYKLDAYQHNLDMSFIMLEYCQFEPDKTVSNFKSSGGTDSIVISATTTWSATTASDWITVPASGESGTTTISISATENTASARTGSIVFTDSNSNTFTVTVNQQKYALVKGKMYRNNAVVNKMYRNGNLIYRRLDNE